MTGRKRLRGGIYLVTGIGIGLMMVPGIRSRILNLFKDSNPKLYDELTNLKDQLVAAVEAGVEAARQKRPEQRSDNLIKFESDEESPNYIV